ncbi:hypothetical protein C8F04DRAFT_1265790 [Mycena alexandri]|uniref:Uncharacterized protein n=1 Tax=Mycena alexandri TaxID=1745969 RepID=A0AAD6SIG4_9AGAR|nr:hypothetical protein C8F04DRAFT_1265790 [Mycena alexandri]
MHAPRRCTHALDELALPLLDAQSLRLPMWMADDLACAMYRNRPRRRWALLPSLSFFFRARSYVRVRTSSSLLSTLSQLPLLLLCGRHLPRTRTSFLFFSGTTPRFRRLRQEYDPQADAPHPQGAIQCAGNRILPPTRLRQPTRGLKYLLDALPDIMKGLALPDVDENGYADVNLIEHAEDLRDEEPFPQRYFGVRLCFVL